jgi:hypothetical protein
VEKIPFAKEYRSDDMGQCILLYMYPNKNNSKLSYLIASDDSIDTSVFLSLEKVMKSALNQDTKDKYDQTTPNDDCLTC